MSEWREVRLGDICDIYDGPHATPPKTDSGNIFLGISSLGFDGRINSSHFEYVSEEVFKKWTKRIEPKYQDIVFSYETKLGVAAMIPVGFKCCLGRRMGLLRPKDGVEPRFLIYAYLAPDFQKVIHERTYHGSTVDRIPLKEMSDFPVSIPDLTEQKAIASVLSSLDDKIDLLHRQNKTLEAMAETLFRQWFVEEAGEDWEVKPLGHVAIVQNGFAFSSKDYVEYQEGYLEVFKMGHIKPGGGLRFSPKANYVPRNEKLERWVLQQDDIVMAMTDMKDSMGILGHPAMIDVSNKYVLNQRVARIYLENSNNLITNYFLYLQLNTEDAIAFLQSKANSGVQVNLSTEAIKSLSLIIPPKDVQNQALKSIEPFFKKILLNRKSIKVLETLRDTLLPKLMSGEVRVDYP